MRLANRVLFVLFFGAGLALRAGAPSRAQDDEVLSPEASAAKAKRLVQQSIQALGGAAYLGVRDVYAVGRFAQFGHSGDLTGYEIFYDYVKMPDKERTEISKKRNIIEVYSGDHGWVLDKAGVEEQPADALAAHVSDAKKDIDYVFRYRLNEPGMIFRYAGPDLVDLKESDWVELTDSDGHVMRFALERATHLPLRAVYIYRDPATRERTQEVDYYSNYQPVQGVQTPFQITGERNGQKFSQIFLDECKYNTNLADELFTRDSLEKRWAQLSKGKKKKG